MTMSRHLVALGNDRLSSVMKVQLAAKYKSYSNVPSALSLFNVQNLKTLKLQGVTSTPEHLACKLADLTVSKRPGTSDRIEIHFPVFKPLYLLFSCMKLVET